MSYPIKYPTPQGANIQIFNSSQSAGTQSWIKPQGASFVWFTLIGAGGAGDGATLGGSSGAVTNCLVPAFLIPDELKITVGRGGFSNGVSAGTITSVVYQQKNGTGYTLLSANGGTNDGSATAAMTSNYFSAMGIFQSVAGEPGVVGAAAPSATTFLSGGGFGSNGPVVANYGYGASVTSNGYFQMQPIIVSVAGALASGISGIGSGGDLNDGDGGNGMVVIISW